MSSTSFLFIESMSSRKQVHAPSAGIKDNHGCPCRHRCKPDRWSRYLLDRRSSDAPGCAYARDLLRWHPGWQHGSCSSGLLRQPCRWQHPVAADCRGNGRPYSKWNGIQDVDLVNNFRHRIIMGLFAAFAVNLIGGAAIYGTGGLLTPLVAPMLGISSGGILAGSTAAAAQAYYGNLAAGSILSQLTSAAMLAPTP